MVKSKAAMQATRRYESQNYDIVRVLLPVGTKDRIRATGSSVNGFIVKAVQTALNSVQAATDQSTVSGETTDGE